MFRLIMVVMLIALGSGCAMRGPNWSDQAEAGKLLVISAIDEMPVYNHAGTTIFEQREEAIYGPKWGISDRIKDKLSHALSGQDHEWFEFDPRHTSEYFSHGFSASLTEKGVTAMRDLREHGFTRAMIIYPRKSAKLYHMGVSSHSYGMVYNCVLFVACYARPFVNLEVAYLDLASDPKIVGGFSEEHPDLVRDYVKGFDEKEFIENPSDYWPKVRVFIEKYIDRFVDIIGEDVAHSD